MSGLCGGQLSTKAEYGREPKSSPLWTELPSISTELSEKVAGQAHTNMQIFHYNM